MRVLGIGESNLDKYIVEEWTSGVRTIRRRTIPGMYLGGTVPAAMVLLARHGIQCEFMTCLGRDKEGRAAYTAFQQEGITLIVHEQDNTKVNTIIDDVYGQRTKNRSNITHAPIKHIDPSYLAQFDLILVDRHERLAFREVVAKKRAMTKVVIDPSTEVSDFTRDMVRHADYPIVPIEWLAPFDQGKGLLAAMAVAYELCGKTLVVTLGELGSLYYNGHCIEFLPALPVKAVDTCGAGDVYRGAFAYGILQGWDYRTCVQYANVAAALQCTKIGNIPAIPSKKDIERHLHQPRRTIDLRHVDDYFRRLARTVELTNA